MPSNRSSDMSVYSRIRPIKVLIFSVVRQRQLNYASSLGAAIAIPEGVNLAGLKILVCDATRCYEAVIEERHHAKNRAYDNYETFVSERRTIGDLSY